MGRALVAPSAPWALIDRALMSTPVSQRLGSMANQLNLSATLKWHKAIYICVHIYIYIYMYIRRNRKRSDETL